MELCSSWLCFWMLVWEPGVLGVGIQVVLAKGEIFVRKELDEVMGP